MKWLFARLEQWGRVDLESEWAKRGGQKVVLWGALALSVGLALLAGYYATSLEKMSAKYQALELQLGRQ